MKKEYCIFCDKDVQFEVKILMVELTIKGKTIKVETTIPFCLICGEEMDIPEYTDKFLKNSNSNQ